MSFLELAFKIVGTVIVILLCVGLVRWLWTNHIDPVETVKRLFKGKAKDTVDWIATRDQNAIYQDSQIVGVVDGTVQETDDKIVFSEIYDTSNLNRQEPIEYRRDRLKIINIEKQIAQKIVASNEGSKVQQHVITNVVCEKIK